MRKVLFTALVLAAALATYGAANGQDESTCWNDTNCPCRDWARVKGDLEAVANTPGPINRGCAEVRVHGGETAYDAFKNCSSRFRGPGLTGGENADRYRQCAPYICNWFRSQNPAWSPAC